MSVKIVPVDDYGYLVIGEQETSAKFFVSENYQNNSDCLIDAVSYVIEKEDKE